MILEIIKSMRMRHIRRRYRRFLRAGINFTCGRGTIFYAKTRIIMGDCVYFGRYCNIECDAVIGSDVLIANNVAFLGRLDHDYMKIGIPVRHSPSIRDELYSPPAGKSEIHVGDDVWIGYGAIILSGVAIGDGSIIAAGSIVTHDVAPFSIVAGVPARKIAERFSTNQIDEHKRLCREKYSSYKE